MNTHNQYDVAIMAQLSKTKNGFNSIWDHKPELHNSIKNILKDCFQTSLDKLIMTILMKRAKILKMILICKMLKCKDLEFTFNLTSELIV